MTEKEILKKINVLKHMAYELELAVILLQKEKERDASNKERSGEKIHHLDVELSNGVAHGKYRTNINQSTEIRSDDE